MNPCADKVEVILEMHLQIDLTSILSLGVKCESSDRNPTNQNMSSQSLTAVVVNRLRPVWNSFVWRKDVETVT